MHVTRPNTVLHRPLARVLMLLGILCGLLGGPCLDRRVEAEPTPSTQVVIDWNDVANSVDLNPSFSPAHALWRWSGWRFTMR